MHERPLYDNWFNQASIVNKRHRRMAAASFIFSLGVLALYLIQ